MFEKHVNELIAGLIAAFVAWFTLILRKLPDYLLEVRQKREFDKLGKLDVLLDEIVDDVGAIYGHVIKYHNGGEELAVGNNWLMSVVWESVGKPCHDCGDRCAFAKKHKRLQSEWQKEPISSEWFKIVQKSYLEREKCHATSIDDKNLGEVQRQIFKRSNIHTYMEVFIKSRKMEFFTLGLSFCDKHEGLKSCGAVIITARQLNKLL
jgi:hypothetical protein